MILHLQEIMDKRYMTSADLADAVGCSRNLISRYLHGRAFPKEDRLRKIARALYVPLWQLFIEPGQNVPIHEVEKGCVRCPHCDGALDIRVHVREK